MKKFENISELKRRQRSLRQKEKDLGNSIAGDWSDLKKRLRPSNMIKSLLLKWVSNKASGK
jgi:hypothetical protein